MMIYALSKGLGVSPLELYKLPISLFRDLFLIHTEIEGYKAEMIEKETRKIKH